ncbi:hypothetical protein LCGC14_0161930 [marine sediment metagenome]|uniref:Leucine Rich repeats (2 copies) n=1 Tax=marine sediment metagenome TaxID=412755 RepID=A0A0F9XX21_9ZZZZ|nr:hypothetical protein [Phycisphaerae bacterium]HDZ45044.1 hypothetical protein [Phycisphaerae bacterium]
MHTRSGLTAVVFVTLGLVCLGCDRSSSSNGNLIGQSLSEDQELSREELLTYGMKYDLASGVFRFVCPVDQASARDRPASKEGRTPGTANLRGIIYDRAYLAAFFWRVTGPISCGAAERWVLQPDGVIEFHGGLDETYLGRRFRYEDLVAVLEARLSAPLVVNEVTITDPRLLARLREYDRLSEGRIAEWLPWETNVHYATHLLLRSGRVEAEPILARLMTDPSRGIKLSAINAWGALGQYTPEGAQMALAQLGENLSVCLAVTKALARTSPAGVSDLISALDHPSRRARYIVVRRLGEMGPDVAQQAVPALLKQLEEVAEDRSAVIRALAKMGVSTDEVGDAIYRATHDSNSGVRREARRALESLFGDDWRNQVPAAIAEPPRPRPAPKNPGPGRENTQYSLNSVRWAPEEADAIQALVDLGNNCNLWWDGRVMYVFFNKHKKQPDDALRHLAHFSRLKGVILHRTQFTNEALRHLKGLTQLRSLTLSGAEFTDAGLAHIAGLTNLMAINMACPNITDEGLRHLAGMSELRLLRLNGAQITDAGLAHLAGLTKLRHLELNDTLITDAGLAHLAGLTEMTSLYLQGTQVTDNGLGHLRGMMKLWALDLRRTGITDQGLGTILESDSLRGIGHLYLADTNVTDAGMSYVGQMPSLQGIALSGTSVTDEGIDQLKGLEDIHWITFPASARGSERAFREHMAGPPSVSRSGRQEEQ